MLDDEYGFPMLNGKVYEMIERKVVELFEEVGVSKFPADPFLIARTKGWILKPISKSKKDLTAFYDEKKIDGTRYYDDERERSVIYYDDRVVKARQRFTIMHEIGHTVLGHKEESDLANQMANCFAAYALAPSPLISKFNCEDYVDICQTFFVSGSCAAVCFKRYLRWMGTKRPLRDYEKKLLEMIK